MAARNRPGWQRPTPGGQLMIDQVQPSQVAAAAGSAIVTAARLGRLLGRSGWRIARQLPGGQAVEREAQRLQNVALGEVRKLLEPSPTPRPDSSVSGEEQRVAAYLQNANPGTDPLRNAMSELLERSVEASRTASREYLFGTIISQLVPDEARILAALADGSTFAAADVVVKHRGRSATRTVLANASAVGRSAGVVNPDNVPTYLTRLLAFGLIEFGAPDDSLSVQFDILATDSTIQVAEASAQARRQGSPRLVRKTVAMSSFGSEFWAACDPSRPALPAGS